MRADALATLGFVEFMRGRPSELMMSEAIELQDAAMATTSWTKAGVFTAPRTTMGLELMWSGRLDEARELLEREMAEYEKHGVYTAIQEVMCYLSEVETRAGRWSQAAHYAAEGMENLVESGRRPLSGQMFLFTQSLVAAHLGRVEDARRSASEGVRLAESNDDPFYGNANRAVLGFLELSLSNFEPAVAHLDPVVAYLERMEQPSRRSSLACPTRSRRWSPWAASTTPNRWSTGWRSRGEHWAGSGLSEWRPAAVV